MSAWVLVLPIVLIAAAPRSVRASEPAVSTEPALASTTRGSAAIPAQGGGPEKPLQREKAKKRKVEKKVEKSDSPTPQAQGSQAKPR